MTAVDEAVALIDAYLQHCEDRELDAARAMWAPGELRMEFPGPARYRSLEELVEASLGLYRWVRKHRDEYAVAVGPSAVTVTSMGRLYGENLHGAAFDDVRYVDVFTIVDGTIRAQRVWNDLAVSGALDRRA